MTNETLGVLARLAEPFPDDDIELRPEITCAECVARQCASHEVKRCRVCKHTISTEHVHLHYVSHAKVTRRLNQVAPSWTWETIPTPDRQVGLWIRLSVTDENGAVHTRPGVGTRAGAKEAIGDAIRNAAMRFGVALDLWDKEDARRDGPASTGRRGLPAGDPRQPVWDFIRLISGWQGRRTPQQVLDHWDAWRDSLPVQADSRREIADVQAGTLLRYLAHILAADGPLLQQVDVTARPAR